MSVSAIIRDNIRQLLIAEPGIKQKDIATRLGINKDTVSRHVIAIRAEREAGE